MFFLGVAWRDTMSIGVARGRMVVGFLNVSNGFVLPVRAVFGCHRGANCGTHCTTGNSALATTHFGTNGCANAATDCTAQYGISINCKCRHTGK